MSKDEILGRLLLDIGLLLLVARALALLLARFSQPPVLAEILAGIALGPSLLGALPGNLSAKLFPAAVQSPLAMIGGLGLTLFMFLIGLELDLGAIRRHNRIVAAVSGGAIFVPMALGLFLATLLYQNHSLVQGHTVPKLGFMLFVATALSITAFPVLARILTDRSLDKTPLGHLAMASAAVQDAVGWILLALSLAAVSAGGSGSLPRLALESSAFVFVVFVIARPLARHGLKRADPRTSASSPAVGLAIVAALACAGVTQLIGLHSALGAFLCGAAFPRQERPAFVASLRGTLTSLTIPVLLPVYFLGPGLNVDVTQLHASSLLQLGVILAFACSSKLVGATVPARVTGLSWRDACALGVLLNTRGLIELIVLNVGLMAGVLDRTLFTELVVVALITTLVTSPLLQLVRAMPRSAAAQQSLLEQVEPPLTQGAT
jgi:Kef-type K+ transport system membrane component KefB